MNVHTKVDALVLFIANYELLVIICEWASKKDQVGAKYIISQNDTYLEYCVQYLLSVHCIMLPVELLIHGKNFTYIASADL